MKSSLKFDQLFKSIHKSSTIILVGFMGSGKTTFGKELAAKLNYQFLDTDKELEVLVGMSVNEIFKKKGETYFRRLERQLIEKIAVQKTVIATGGGMPCFFDNMDYLNRIGVTVYLRYSAEQLFERLKEDGGSRPLLNNKSSDELFDYIESLLNEREKFYLKAQTTF